MKKFRWNLPILVGFLLFSVYDAQALEIVAADAGNPGHSISLNMPDVPIVDALRMVAKLAGINLIIDSDVEGTINLFFDDVPLEEAWQALLDSAKLKSENKGNLIHLSLAKPPGGDALPLETRVIQLKHITLGTDSLTSGSGNFSAGSSDGSLSGTSRGTGGVDRSAVDEPNTIDKILIAAFGEDKIKAAKDERSNTLVLTAAPAILNEAIRLVDSLDQPSAQILIEAKVIQARSDVLDNLGIHWGGIYTIQSNGNLTLSSERGLVNPANALTESSNQSGNFSASLDDFSVTVSALVEHGDARVLSSPRVVTQNNREAFISSGQEIQVPSGLDINGNATYREREVTLELGVTPRLLAESQINLVIRLRNDSINYSQEQISGVPPLNINSVESLVTLRNRDTVALGGIITQQDTYSTFRVPMLADVPLLGGLFQQRKKQKENSELIILITPSIISDGSGVVKTDGITPGGMRESSRLLESNSPVNPDEKKTDAEELDNRDVKKGMKGSKVRFRGRSK